MSTTDFASILSQRSESIERPKPVPVGTYAAMVEGIPEMRNIGKKDTPAAEFSFKLIAPGPDVDTTALTEMGGLTDKKLRKPFFLTEESLYRLKEFLVDHLGIDEGKKSIGELISESPNRSVTVVVSHRLSEDKSQVYAEIKSTARA